ncbi:alpha/beta hydrolase [Hyphomicrobium sp. LHD-15]|uniref:alpha/beta hydrolase n=1 Tax=Hyphomicrobium sp. LHD-15 TaxID=3072142 RepID=UPI00280D48FE|nr:alpha/beta hydrolase [Hyphomicrobium sp. LHD-15]MDQ8698304.1 alpha/beta hydrolase [Hyphomicrobium sp. LHD-15]
MRRLGLLAVCLAAISIASCGEAPKSGSPPPATAPAPGPGAEAPPPPATDDIEPSAGAPPPEAAPDEADRGQGRLEEGQARPRAAARPPAAAPDPVGSGAPPPVGAPPPPAPAEEAKSTAGDWDVVPIYYGTDRTQSPNEKRLDYGSERGRRLELGRALVTVPKAHKVPSIERPWAIRVFNVTLYEEAEDPNRHFTMDEIKALSEEEFLTLVKERLAASARYKDHAFIFVHGYNTSFDYAIYRAAQISYDLKFDGAAFAYSWPSGGGLASYTYDRESSGQAEPYLKQFMELVINKSGAKSVSVIAHSMGNQPTLQVLKDLRRSKPDGVQISQIILAAPDVDRDNFENIAAEIRGLASGVTLYAAGNDRALRVSRNFYGGIPRAGDVPPTGPLVLPGIDTIDVSAASTDSLGLNHSGYAENNALLDDIAALIATGTRPPKLRTPSLEEVTTDRGAYWRYPAARP